MFDPVFSETEIHYASKEAMLYNSKQVCSKIAQSLKCYQCKETIEVCDLNYKMEQPSAAFLNNFQKLVLAINDMLPHICHEKFVKKQLREIVDEFNFEIMGCPEHFEDVENKFKEKTIIFEILQFCNNINNLLSGKNKILAPDSTFMEKMALSFKAKKKDIGKYSKN